MREAPDQVAFPDTLIRIRIDVDQILPDFLASIWNSPFVRHQVESLARTTAGIYKVNQRHLAAVSIPVPTLETQARFCTSSQNLALQQERLLVGVVQTEAHQSSLRRSLLEAAFSGRLTGRSSDSDIAEELADA